MNTLLKELQFDDEEKVKKLLITFITGAFSFMVASSMNGTLQLFFTHYIKIPGNVILANFIYTIIITAISIYAIIFLSKNT